MSNNEEKIRLRSDEELERQNKGLQEVKVIFEKIGIPYFLASGTLLGAVREKNFIRWDWDVQCYLTTETAFDVKDEIIKAFTQEGFVLETHNPNYDSLKFVFTKYGAEYEITSWYKKGDMRYRTRYSQLPAKFFENTAVIDFLGAEYPCMTPAEEYLEFCYGDWRTPKRTMDKNEYLNPNFFKYPMWVRRITEFCYRLMGIPKKILNRFKF